MMADMINVEAPPNNQALLQKDFGEYLMETEFFKVFDHADQDPQILNTKNINAKLHLLGRKFDKVFEETVTTWAKKAVKQELIPIGALNAIVLGTTALFTLSQGQSIREAFRNASGGGGNNGMGTWGSGQRATPTRFQKNQPNHRNNLTSRRNTPPHPHPW